MFKKILIANRGEIAVRIMKTCREMGIETVAVFSDTDRKALHVLEADNAVCLGESEPAKSYLNMEKIIAAAKETGTEAIHPGYGFLAENSAFAAKCRENDIVFIGPPAQVIHDLGDKTIARQIMINGGVPVIPGMTRAEPDPKKMAQEADKIGYPVMIKAAAGGGGKGMRVVTSPEDIEKASIAASSEAKSAFGSGAVYPEKYISQSRHVEVQIMADENGDTIHLMERECSIQRRHQKIIEETPSTALSPELRDRMGAAAVAAAKASGYVNAGTVEFLLDKDNQFYFLEVNTRLQVEHPITEMITGIDLVRKQIEIASGLPLGLSQADIRMQGHAIECRIYAEDPENSFFPSPGEITCLKEPTGPGVRNDCGVYSGFQVPVEYDPIISKLVVHAESRGAAIDRMIHALSSYVILGVTTPIPFLIDVLKSEAFRSGKTYTDFIDTYFTDWKPEKADSDLACISFIVDEIAKQTNMQTTSGKIKDSVTPWQTLGNWRIS
jgi:acetyl-CoA carboxylase biotin carboxylase subunit